MHHHRAARSAIFVAASAAAHAALLLVWGGATNVKSPQAFSGAELTVAFATEPVVSLTTQRTSAATTEVQQPQRTGQRPAAQRRDQQASVPHATPDTTRNTAESPALAEHLPAEPDTRTWLRSRISDELGRYFTYPPLARQRGLSGTVVLSYRVEPDGRLEQMAVARSSGYALLDRSALTDLSRVPPLSDAIPRLRGTALEETLAVIYRLRDN